MVRKIIHIDKEKCNGCGACAAACHEGAIAMIDGKATLMREDYCDGFGDCLPACPAGAISFVEREAPAYDEQAVLENKRREAQEREATGASHGCPGQRLRRFAHAGAEATGGAAEAQPASMSTSASTSTSAGGRTPARLEQWPCQLRLIPASAPYFDGMGLLVAADCTAYAYANFHEDFMKNKITLIGCPKLDDADYTEKLTDILRRHEVRSLTIVRMEVPCCGGLERAAVQALKNSGKLIPWRVVVISTDGKILQD